MPAPIEDWVLMEAMGTLPFVVMEAIKGCDGVGQAYGTLLVLIAGTV